MADAKQATISARSAATATPQLMETTPGRTLRPSALPTSPRPLLKGESQNESHSSQHPVVAANRRKQPVQKDGGRRLRYWCRLSKGHGGARAQSEMVPGGQTGGGRETSAKSVT